MAAAAPELADGITLGGCCRCRFADGCEMDVCRTAVQHCTVLDQFCLFDFIIYQFM
jgi:hypothetical protein